MHRNGFTLIELLIVVVIIGVLAVIALPKYAAVREKANIAAMKSDLRNLATLEETQLADFGVYAAVNASNPHGGVPVPDAATGFIPSSDVTITGATVAAGAGWHAVAAHAAVPARTCEIFVGGGQVASPGGLSTVEGEPRCG